MELKKKVIVGLCWNMLGSGITQGLGFITKVIIARTLFPSDFGLFAMALILINFMSIFVGFGMMSALVYRKEDPEKTFNTAFVLSCIIGCCLFIVSYFSSGFIASFFNEPVLKSMIKVLSVVFIFDSVSTILSGSLLKNLEFKKRTIIDILAVCCYGGSAILLAVSGFGVWSLVIAYVIHHGFIMILLWVICRKRPQWNIDMKIAREVLSFGKYVMSTAFLAWAITSIDNILVGKKMGDENLGYYSFSFNIAALPVLQITGLFTSVFHPVYAKLQGDYEKLKRAYLKPLEWSLVFILPIAAGMFLLADRIVYVLFGEKWVPMIPLLKIFAVYCIFRTVCTIISQLLEGIGKPKTASLLLAIEFVILGIVLIPAIMYKGILGAAVAVVSARGISMILHLTQTKKILAIGLRDYVPLVAKKLLCTILMVVAVYLMGYILMGNTLVNLFVFIVTGALVYGISLFFMEKRIFKEAQQVVKIMYP